MLLTAELQALMAIADRHGGQLTPEIVLNAARSAEHPLHERFEWDDATAAEAHRLNQARGVIRSARLQIVIDGRPIEAPMFVRNPAQPAGEQGYISVSKLASDEDSARSAVLAAFASAASHLARARSIATALGLADEITKLEDQLTHVQRLAQGPAAVRTDH